MPSHDDEIGDEDVQKARDAYDEGVKIARVIYKNLQDQGADNAVLHLIGLEMSAMALNDKERPAPKGAKRGAIALYAHRVLDETLPLERQHLQDECDICMMAASLRKDL